MKQQKYPDIDRWLEQQTPAMLEDIFMLLRIPSVSSPTCGDYPYGVGCGKALDCIADIVKRLGFSFCNHGYHCGTVLLPGKSDREIGVFTHIDTVPEGSGWSRDPYVPYCKEGHIFGRGSTDNKGPAVAALYLLVAIRDHGIKLDHSIRLYFGCDEEAGMGDISYYLDNQNPPELSLVPDARYSVCHGEKGIVDLEFSLDITDSNLVDFYGGMASNMVPDYAQLTLRGVNVATCLDKLTVEYGCTVITKGTDVVITAKGISAHAAFPESGTSATAKLSAAVTSIGLADSKGSAALATLSAAFSDFHGAGMNISTADLSGKLTHVGGILRYHGGKLLQQVNIRYPVTLDGQLLKRQIVNWCGENKATLLSYKDNPPIFVDATHPIIQLLNRIACEELKCDLTPYTMGGGTYARKLPLGMAFGPLLKELPRPGGGGHQPDECVSIEGLCRFIKIYLLALWELDTTL